MARAIPWLVIGRVPGPVEFGDAPIIVVDSDDKVEDDLAVVVPDVNALAPPPISFEYTFRYLL